MNTPIPPTIPDSLKEKAREVQSLPITRRNSLFRSLFVAIHTFNEARSNRSQGDIDTARNKLHAELILELEHGFDDVDRVLGGDWDRIQKQTDLSSLVDSLASNTAGTHTLAIVQQAPASRQGGTPAGAQTAQHLQALNTSGGGPSTMNAVVSATPVSAIAPAAQLPPLNVPTVQPQAQAAVVQPQAQAAAGQPQTQAATGPAVQAVVAFDPQAMAQSIAQAVIQANQADRQSARQEALDDRIQAYMDDVNIDKVKTAFRTGRARYVLSVECLALDAAGQPVTAMVAVPEAAEYLNIDSRGEELVADAILATLCPEDAHFMLTGRRLQNFNRRQPPAGPVTLPTAPMSPQQQAALVNLANQTLRQSSSRIGTLATTSSITI